MLATDRSFQPQRALHWLNATAILESLVGVSWQHHFARAVGVTLPAYGVLLFSGLWLVYTSDRLLDARHLASDANAVSYRHDFSRRHWKSLGALWVSVLLGSIALALWRLDTEQWLNGAVLLCGAIVYMLLVQIGRDTASRAGVRVDGMKELSVALLYTAGTTLFIPLRSELLAPCLAFFGLALLNVVSIAEQERDVDEHHVGLLSVAHSRTPARRVLWGLIAFALSTSTVLAFSNGQLLTRTFLPILISGLLLLALRRGHRYFAPDTSHALADAALLTPLLVG